MRAYSQDLRERVLLPNSKPPYAAQELEPEKPWKRLLLKRYSLSPPRIHKDGFSIAAIFFLGRKGRVKHGSIFEHAGVV